MIARRTDLGAWSDAEQAVFNAAFASDAATYSDSQIDVAALFPDENDTTYFQTDKVHLNDAGAAIVAGLIRDEIEANISEIV